jgi:hypothetical protein
MIFLSNFDLAGCGGQWRSAGLPSLPCSGRGLSAVIASSCGRGIGGGPELVPLLGPGPMCGQMQNGSALRPGQSGGHGDEVAAQRRTAGGRVAVSGEGAGGAEQVVRDRRADRPRGVGRELARRQMGQRSVDDVGQDGLDDRVLAVGDVGLGGVLGAVGEERVVPPLWAAPRYGLACWRIAAWSACLGVRGRHNQRLSRKANNWSMGR